MGGGDVLVQQAQGRGARCTGEVELGELALGEGRNQRFIYNLTICLHRGVLLKSTDGTDDTVPSHRVLLYFPTDGH